MFVIGKLAIEETVLFLWIGEAKPDSDAAQYWVVRLAYIVKKL